MRHLIIDVDLVGSTASKQAGGDGRMIEQRLQDIESAFRVVDPTLVRHSAAGDSVLLLGTGAKAVDLYRTAVQMQGGWGALPTGSAARMSMGLADLGVSKDGDYRHTEIDFTHRLLEVCPEGHVVVTESLGIRLIESGHEDSLIPMSGEFKGFGAARRYFEVDGKFVKSEGSRPPAVRIDKRQRRDSDVSVGVGAGKPNGLFWKVLAAVALAGAFIVAFVLIVFPKRAAAATPEAPTIQQIQSSAPEGLWHFLSQLPASFEAELLYALMLSGLVGVLGNFIKKWARGEIDGGLIHYLFIDNVRGTWLSLITIFGLAVTAISSNIFMACPHETCSSAELLFVGWKAVLYSGVTSGFTADAIANKSAQPVWSEERRAAEQAKLAAAVPEVQSPKGGAL